MEVKLTVKQLQRSKIEDRFENLFLNTVVIGLLTFSGIMLLRLEVCFFQQKNSMCEVFLCNFGPLHMRRECVGSVDVVVV